MAKKDGKRRRKRGEWKYTDFAAVLAIPDRLAEYLRMLCYITKPEWDFALAKVRQGDAYREWTKSKGRGKGRRHFAAPCEELKLVQRHIHTNLLSQIPVHCARHGVAGTSILTNARTHAGFAKTVFSVDIINAFPSVFRSRIRANLRKPLKFALRQFPGVEFAEAPLALRQKCASEKDHEKRVALLSQCLQHDFDFLLEALVDLVCLHDKLPQGPPTSPRILAIVCMKLDMDIFALLQKHGTPFQSYRYTVYADDLTISSDGAIPEEVQKEILDTIRVNGFIPHTREDKTKYYDPATKGELPVITGLVLNPDGRTTMAPQKVNQIRGKLHRLWKQPTWTAVEQGEAAGLIGYVRQVYPRTLPAKLKLPVSRIETRLGRTIEASPPPVSPDAPAPTPETAPEKKTRKSGRKKKGKGDEPPTAQEAVA